MDLILMVVGGAVAFLGTRLKHPQGIRTQQGNIVLGVGAAILVVGLIIFSATFGAAFIDGFSQGVKDGS